MASLLPPNATVLQRAIEDVSSQIGAVPVPIDQVRNPWTCPAHLLPWLAWSCSVDSWNSGWSEYTKRAVIAASFDVHRRKGTPYSVKTAIAAVLGHEPIIVEGLHRPRRDGTYRRNGHYFRGWADAWAMYRLVLTRPITVSQAAEVRRIADMTAPARSQLLSIDFQTAPFLRDGSHRRDGNYTRGVS